VVSSPPSSEGGGLGVGMSAAFYSVPVGASSNPCDLGFWIHKIALASRYVDDRGSKHLLPSSSRVDAAPEFAPESALDQK
jgi:hypothetical protein